MNPATVGSFELIELLGEGGVGQVYSARDPVLGRRVAIKMLRRELSDDREFRDRFYGEAQRLGDLNHANITTLYGLHFADDKPFMVMELVRGRTLKELREAAGRLPPRESLAVLAQTLAGLAYAHRAGVIHRDIKPSNLMIADGGIVKIMDFGIARVRGSAHVTRAGQTLLTPLYASPEQIKGEEVDERSDLYSLGVVFYEMLAGRPPFTAKSEYLLERAHLEEPPPPLSAQVPGLDPAIEAAVLRALAKNPEDRFASAEEFGRAIGARAIRGDAPDILQDFVAAAFREAPPDETRRIGRTSGVSAPLIRDPEGKNRSATSTPSQPVPVAGIGRSTEGASAVTGEPAGEPPPPVPENGSPADLLEEGPRKDRDEGAAARTPGDEFSLKGAGISPPPESPVAAIRSDIILSATSRPQPGAPVRAAILGGIALALLLGLGTAGLRSWGPALFARHPAPERVAAITPPSRPSAPLPRPSAVAAEGSTRAATPSAPPHPVPPPAVSVGNGPAADKVSPRLASAEPLRTEPPKTETPAQRAAPAPPPKSPQPAAIQKPAATSRIAPVKPPKSAAPPADRASPVPPHLASAEPPRIEPPKIPSPPARTILPAGPQIAALEPPPAPPKLPSPPGPAPLPQPRPDLEGIVTGAMNASTIKIGERWIALYGIDDPTRKLQRHVEAVAGYLAPARGRVACYRKAARRYQCYSSGRDLALLALRDGIARLARDAPPEYREAALRRENRRKQP